ncbi:MAG: zinc-ribbon domain-containing protein [Paracoccaceae bacterium]
MRLICPNCGAQYEVDDSVIPENGRDVQCSNCGHTWFQRAANSDTEETEASPSPESSVDEPASSDVSPEKEPEASEEIAQVTSAETDPEPTPPASAPKRQELDSDVTGILRQEAERETAERASENVGLETQPDLGLSESPEDSDANIQKKMDRLRGLDDDHGAAAAAAAIGRGPRKDLLPDIEELNSTLTASTDVGEEEADESTQEQRQRSGFRRAFVVTILIFTILVLLYAFAPQIAAKVPALKSILASYVDWVNALRLAVDTMMQKAVDKLTALVSQISGDRTDAG